MIFNISVLDDFPGKISKSRIVQGFYEIREGVVIQPCCVLLLKFILSNVFATLELLVMLMFNTPHVPLDCP